MHYQLLLCTSIVYGYLSYLYTNKNITQSTWTQSYYYNIFKYFVIEKILTFFQKKKEKNCKSANILFIKCINLIKKNIFNKVFDKQWQ